MLDPRTPKWSFALLPHIDFIGETDVCAFLFNTSYLETLNSAWPPKPVLKALLNFFPSPSKPGKIFEITVHGFCG